MTGRNWIRKKPASSGTRRRRQVVIAAAVVLSLVAGWTMLADSGGTGRCVRANISIGEDL